MSPEHQHLSIVTNLIAYIDGSATRVCVQCGEIFKRGPGRENMLCENCQCERENSACCDSPAPHTISSTEAEDGTRFSTVVCQSCGKRKEIEW